jgi:hypothetical protein
MNVGDLRFVRYQRVYIGFAHELLELRMGQVVLVVERATSIYGNDNCVKILTADGINTAAEYEIVMYTEQFD